VIKVGICGFGYWGPNLFRNFRAHRRFKVLAVSDLKEVNRAKAQVLDPYVRVYEHAYELIDDPQIEAVAIATPVGTHFKLARRALSRFKHVLVEKPMCASSDEGAELIELSARTRRTLMVNHTYLFHGVVRKLAEMNSSGALGKVSYFDSVRINLGLFQPDMNVLWDLAPHDFSILDHLFEEEPVHIEATGYCHVNDHLPDISYITMHFASQMIAHFHLSWMSPVKVRRISIGGSTQMAVWDDLNPDERLKIYDTGIEIQPEDERSVIVPGYRIGDIYSPRIGTQEPLADVIEHFCQVIGGKEDSLVGGRQGLRVVRMLEKSQRALKVSLSKIYARAEAPGTQRQAR
jgi:predicted dehydrogenase